MDDLEPSQAGGTGRRSILLGATATAAATAATAFAAGPFLTAQAQTPTTTLASWNDGPAKQAILDFVHATTDQSTKDFVPPEDRIATFDQDGTLWVEHPGYGQAMFALERVHALAPRHPEWQTQEPFKSVLSNDPAAIGKFGESDWMTILGATLAGMSEEEFTGLVRHWAETAKHPSIHASSGSILSWFTSRCSK